MHLWPEMMFSVVTVKEPSPVVNLPVSAYAPRNRLVRITAVMPVVTVQVREAVAKVPEWEKETDVTPVQNTKDNKVRDDRRELKHSQKGFARIFALQFPENGLGIFAKEAEEGVRERMFSFTFEAVFVILNPINGPTVLVRAVGVSLVMLHVNAFVEDLAEPDGG
jgi:hypothetical protein